MFMFTAKSEYVTMHALELLWLVCTLLVKAGFVKNALLPSSCLQLSVMTNLDYLLPDRET